MRISLEQAMEKLKQGEVVAVPTETVYGLAACCHDIQAVKQIYALKGRPSNNPLIIHLGMPADIHPFAASLPKHFEALANNFWPGPMTLVIPVKAEAVATSVNAGLPSAAFRIPNHPVALELIKKTGPLVMPSANLSGRPSSTLPEHVEADFGKDFPVLDGGICTQGVESTVLCWIGDRWVLGRHGALPKDSFAKILGYIPEERIKGNSSAAPMCPGQLYRHYAPKARLHLSNSISKDWQGAIVGFEDRTYAEGCRFYSLGHSLDAKDAAHRLYTILRELDDDGVEEAAVDTAFPSDGLWVTLQERLQKAASISTHDECIATEAFQPRFGSSRD